MNLVRTWFARRPETYRYEKLANVCMLQFHPGLGRERYDSPIQPAGNMILMALWHRLVETTDKGLLNVLDFRGYTAEVRGDGLHYGGSRGCEFILDGRIRPGVPNAKAMNPERQGGLLKRYLGLVHAANRLRGSFVADAVPLFPEVLAVFNASPEFEVTPMLRRVAARRLGCEEGKLDEAVAVDQYLPQLFAEFVREPRTAKNPTGLWLLPAIFTTRHQGIFMEDVSDMLMSVENPVPMLLNPCKQVLKEMKMDYDRLLDVSVEGNRFEEFLRRYRDFLGAELHVMFTDEDIERAVLQVESPLTTADGKTLADILGPQRFLEAVRRNAEIDDVYRDVITMNELEAAVQSPNESFRIGVCRPQAVYLRGEPEVANSWQPHVLENAVHADLWVDKLRMKQKKEHHGGRRQPAAQPAG